jgi:hypothetical protein
MKLTIPAIVLAALMPITPATAQEDACQLLGDMAAAIMWNRQIGTPIGDMWDIAQSAEDEPTRILAEAMVIDAYNSPQFSTDVSRLLSIETFSAEIEAICYEEMGL